MPLFGPFARMTSITLTESKPETRPNSLETFHPSHSWFRRKFPQAIAGLAVAMLSEKQMGNTMTTENRAPLTRIQKYALRKVHPRKLMIDSAGLLWMTYFLWNQTMLEAILVMLVFSTVSLLLVRKVDPHLMAETFLGRIALLHLHPGNLSIQLIGFGILVYGIWTHSIRALLLGVSVILVGHSFGWEKVSSHLNTKKIT